MLEPLILYLYIALSIYVGSSDYIEPIDLKRLLRIWLNRIDTKPVTCRTGPKVPFAVTRHICPHGNFNGMKIVTSFKCIFELIVPKLSVNVGNHNSQDCHKNRSPSPVWNFGFTAPQYSDKSWSNLPLKCHIFPNSFSLATHTEDSVLSARSSDSCYSGFVWNQFPRVGIDNINQSRHHCTSVFASLVLCHNPRYQVYRITNTCLEPRSNRSQHKSNEAQVHSKSSGIQWLLYDVITTLVNRVFMLRRKKKNRSQQYLL